MRITINNKEIPLNPTEVKSCRKQVAKIIATVRDVSEKRNRMSYFFTFLIMMHIMSQEMLNEMDPDTLSFVMDVLTRLPEEAE